MEENSNVSANETPKRLREVKKKGKANLSKSVSRNVLVGINLALLTTLLALNYWTKPMGVEEREEEPPTRVVASAPIIDVPEDVPPPPPPPPDAPPPPPPPPDVITEVELTDNPPPPPPKPVNVPPPVNVPTNVRVVTPLKPQGPPAPPPPPPPKQEKRTAKRLAAREVDQMAVYPGCDRDRDVRKASNAQAKKQALIACFSQKLGEDITAQLDQDDLSEHAQDYNKELMAAKLKFVVDTDGTLIEIAAYSGGDDYLRPEAQRALQKVAERLRQKGGMVPAKYNDGNEVQMDFSIPVKFRIEL